MCHANIEYTFQVRQGLQHVLRRLHAVSAGRGQGKPLMLFLHGFPELWFSWRRQLEEFRDEYEVWHRHLVV